MVPDWVVVGWREILNELHSNALHPHAPLDRTVTFLQSGIRIAGT